MKFYNAVIIEGTVSKDGRESVCLHTVGSLLLPLQLCDACNILFSQRYYLGTVSWKVIALSFVQIVEDTEKYQEKSSEPESHHLEANFGKFLYCKDSVIKNSSWSFFESVMSKLVK